MAALPPGSSLPPGTSSRVLTAVRLMRDTPRWMPAWRDRYGDPFLVRSLNGDVVITGRPELVKPLLALGPDDFVPFATELAAPVVGQASLLITAGERHRRDRKLLSPPFHGERLRAYGDAMRQLTVRGLEAVKNGEIFSMLDFAQAITLDIIVKVVFGVEDPARLRRYGEVTRAALDAAHPAFLFARTLQRDFGGVGPFAAFLRKKRAARALLQEQIARARAAEQPGEDVLSLLLSARYDDGQPMPDEEVIDQLITLLFAGHETTAIALAWAVYYVHKDRDVLERLHQELASVEPRAELWAQLPYLRAVCDEVLRIQPIVPEVMRTLKRSVRVGEWEVPAGAAVSMSVTLLHQDPELYPEPKRFRPERFLERSFGPHEWMPFGGGNRRCLGAAFAQQELRIALATLLLAGQFSLVDEDVQPRRRSLTLAPHPGVNVRFARRAPAQPAA